MNETTADIQKLEEKLYRALDLFKQNQLAYKRLEKELAATKQDLLQQAKQTKKTQQELKVLRRQRDEVRARVETLLKRVSNLTKGKR